MISPKVLLRYLHLHMQMQEVLISPSSRAARLAKPSALVGVRTSRGPRRGRRRSAWETVVVWMVFTRFLKYAAT